MDFILTELKHNPSLRRIIELTRDCPQEIYLVGGWLRDIMLKRKTKTRSGLSRGNLFYGDFDFAVSSQAIRLSREIAKKLKSGFVILDKEHGSTRIIYETTAFPVISILLIFAAKISMRICCTVILRLIHWR